MRLWLHLWKWLFPDHLCLLIVWFNTDFHFSRQRSTFPLQVAADHQRWLAIDCIHGDSASQPFCLALFVSLFTTHLERCQTSYWWLIVGWSLFMELLMDTWRCVAILLMVTSLVSSNSMHLEKPSFSIALDDVTSETWTTLNATTSQRRHPLACRCHIWRSVLDCHNGHHHQDWHLLSL